jgi:hypothetical protein
MAIIVETEKKNSNILAFFGWFVVIGIIVAAAYYIFFVTPPSAVILPAGSLQGVKSLPAATTDPQKLLTSQEFGSLQQYVAEPTSTGPVPVGRQDPFVAP